jgi:low temperature requirement protein LtrA
VDAPVDPDTSEAVGSTSGDDALVRPPRIQADTDRSASRLELFFDLAFVLAVHQSALRFGGELTWSGAAVTAGLITVLWWAWASSTLYANRFDTDDVLYRLGKLAGMGAVVILAATAPTAVGVDAWRFALAYAALRVILVIQYARAYRHVPDARAAIRVYLYAHGAGGVLWLVSIPTAAPARYWLWAAGIVIELAAPPLAGLSGGDAPLHLGHLPERFALFVILVLGESVAAVAMGLQASKWKTGPVIASVPAFVIAVSLWWIYFDLSGAAAKQRLNDEGSNSRIGVHDRYLFAHLPLAGGLLAVAVGLDHAITSARGGETESGARWALVGGLVLYLLASAALQALSEPERSRLLPPALAIAAAVAIGFLVTGITMLVLIAVVLVALVVVGLLRREAGDLHVTEV